jgi:hypothetical protein
MKTLDKYTTVVYNMYMRGEQTSSLSHPPKGFTKMAISQNYFEVTDEQLAACERHLNTHGKPFYTVKSASNDGTYTVRWHEGYKNPSCNCQADPGACWHFRAVLQSESIYQDSLESEARSAAIREAKAVKRDGAKAYERTPFSLLKTA